MKKALIHVNGRKGAAVAAAKRVASAAAEAGLEIAEGASSGADVVLVIGGDGTMLGAAHAYPGLPLLGLNFGSLGFLADVEECDFAAALKAVAEGRYTVSERVALSVSGKTGFNEIVISRGVSGHAALLELSVDGRFAARFLADGLAFSTPTGSTAYSLAAGGPILLPETRCFVVTPICPHSLSSRPLVLPDTSSFRVALEPRSGAEAATVFADGERVGRLEAGAGLDIVRSAQPMRLVRLESSDPFRTLSRKLGWAGSSFRPESRGAS